MFRRTLIAAALAAASLVAPLAAQTPQQTPPSTPAPAAAPVPQPTPASAAQPPFATANQPAQTPSTLSATGTDLSTTIALLDRMQKILDDAIDGKPGEVKIERGLVDEMRAELAQAKLALKGSQ